MSQLCAFPGCDRVAKGKYGKKFCSGHYEQRRLGKELSLLPYRRPRLPGNKRRTVRDCWMYHRYGSNEEFYNKLHESQKGLCAICGGKEGRGEDLRVDHNHSTGEIRGLLCTACNLGVGYFKDDPDILIKAIEYLKKWNH